MKSDFNNKQKFMMELSEVLCNEEYLFELLGSDADNFRMSRNPKTPTLEMELQNGKVYELTLKEKQ